jgi:hypothetical protein
MVEKPLREAISSSTRRASSWWVGMEVDSPPATRRATDSGSQPQGMKQTTTKAIQEIETLLQGAGLLVKAYDAWKHVKIAAIEGCKPGGSQDAPGVDTQAQDIKDIKTELKELSKTVQGLAKQPGPKDTTSYASVVKNGGAPKGPTQEGKRVVPVPLRHYKETLIQCGVGSASQESRRGGDWVRKANEAIGKEDTIVRARKLQSGSIVLTFKNQEEKDKWERDPQLLGAFGDGAKRHAREYTVLAFDIRVDSINLDNQDNAIKEVYQQNPQLQGQVEIIQLGWAKKAMVQKRAFAALHIGIATPEQANTLIQQGFRLENRLHRCEPFFRDCQVNQCVRCHEYTHIAKHCPNRARCGFCASIGHKSQECMKKDKREAHQCALCKNPNANHTAWAKECPIRVQKQREARQAYSKRPRRFQEKENSSPRGIITPQMEVPCTQFNFTASSQVQLNQVQLTKAQSSQVQPTRVQSTKVQPTQVQSDSEDEDFIEVPAPKRKRGRPTTSKALSKAAKNIKDIRSTFQGIGLAGARQASSIDGLENCNYQGPGATQESPLAMPREGITQELSISQELSFAGPGEWEAPRQQRSMSEVTL